MTPQVDPGFDPRIAEWLEADPDRAPNPVLETVLAALPHVSQRRRGFGRPWRLPTMNGYTRLAAVVGVIAIAVFGLANGLAPQAPPGPGATQSPEPTSGPTVVALPQFTETFESDLHGFSVRHPAGWTVRAATEPWVAGAAPNNWGSPRLDEFTGTSPRVRFVVASQPILPDETAEAWIEAYLTNNAGCLGGLPSPQPPRSEPLLIGGQPGFLSAQNGCPVGDGLLYDAVVVVGDRGYNLTLDGTVDRAFMDALLATIEFDPEDAPALIGAVVLDDAGCTFTPGPEPLAAGRSLILARNDTPDGAGFDLWRMRDDVPFSDLAAHIAVEQRRIAEGLGPLGYRFDLADLRGGHELDPGETAYLQPTQWTGGSDALSAGTYGIVCTQDLYPGRVAQIHLTEAIAIE